jgi:hypothetical protein
VSGLSISVVLSGGKAMKYIGVLLALNGLAIGGWYMVSENPQKSWAISICLIAVLCGVFLVFKERLNK